jgi:hypothetical protein
VALKNKLVDQYEIFKQWLSQNKNSDTIAKFYLDKVSEVMQNPDNIASLDEDLQEDIANIHCTNPAEYFNELCNIIIPSLFRKFKVPFMLISDIGFLMHYLETHANYDHTVFVCGNNHIEFLHTVFDKQPTLMPGFFIKDKETLGKLPNAFIHIPQDEYYKLPALLVQNLLKHD